METIETGDGAAPGIFDAEARPFLKWVGGKAKLLPDILPLLEVMRLRAGNGRYHEPFLGGGAVFFALRPKYAYLSDANPHLVRTYAGVEEDPAAVCRALDRYRERHDAARAFADERRAEAEVRALYNTTRSLVPTEAVSDPEAAAWFLYLNRACFNGLWRVNKAGLPNSPWGKRMGALSLPSSALLTACSKAMRCLPCPAGSESFFSQSCAVAHSDFGRAFECALAGDVVYADPPYAPITETSSFTGYAKDGFGAGDQERLRDLAAWAARRGVRVVVSNSDAPLIRSLYADTSIFSIREVQAARSVNATGSGRGKITELLIVADAKEPRAASGVYKAFVPSAPLVAAPETVQGLKRLQEAVASREGLAPQSALLDAARAAVAAYQTFREATDGFSAASAELGLTSAMSLLSGAIEAAEDKKGGAS